MILIHRTILLSSPTRPELEGFELRALADSGAVHLCIPDQGVLSSKPDPPISSREQWVAFLLLQYHRRFEEVSDCAAALLSAMPVPPPSA